MNHILRTLPISDFTGSQLSGYLSDICDWEKISYGEGLHRTPPQLLEWLDRENRGFYCVIDENDVLLSYIDIWSIEPTFYQKLKAGLELEEEIPSTVLCSIDSASGYWYAGSIITNPEYRKSQPQLAHQSFRAICQILTSFFSSQAYFPLEVLGVASSKTGQRIFELWEFEPVQMDNKAIDKRPRYSRILNDGNESAIFSTRLLKF